MRLPFLLILMLVSGLAGCASLKELAGDKKLDVPAEFHQKAYIKVPDAYDMYQAPRAAVGTGDFQSFHTQTTFPIQVEESFKQMFDSVKVIQSVQALKTVPGQVPPPYFEVQITDLTNDIFNDETRYRSEMTITAAVKNVNGETFWQRAFLGRGESFVDNDFSLNTAGPEQAVIDAERDALDQMQRTLIASPEIKLLLRETMADQGLQPAPAVQEEPPVKTIKKTQKKTAAQSAPKQTSAANKAVSASRLVEAQTASEEEDSVSEEEAPSEEPVVEKTAKSPKKSKRAKKVEEINAALAARVARETQSSGE